MDTVINKKDLAFFALGGLGEVGKNMYILQYSNQIFIIDAGILFPDDHLLGVDYVIQDFEYLQKNEEKIVGLFITHGHEDHIGGIPFLLKKIRIPKIYAAGIAVDLIQNKLMDYKDLPQVQIIEFKSHFVYTFKDIELSFIRMNHSIPDSYAFVFKTPYGNVVHTGDFKIDLTPVGPQMEYEKLARLGSEGVLMLTADSTNALVPGFTESERKIGNSIKEMFNHIDGRVIVATFASNIYRVQQIIEASILNKRKIAVFGRSMEKTIEIGQQVGYIKAPKGQIIDASEIDKLKPEEVTLLCTGSQGEPLAALSRIAGGSHRQIKLNPGDTIIFSSSPIPGNQEGVNKTINLLFKNGANVITHSPLTDTHTSGHASQGELKLLQALLKPKYFIPVHGEYRMQRVHADLAIECGIKKENTFILENGEVWAVNEYGARISGRVPSGDVYIDGTQIGDISSSIIRERKVLSEDGLFALVITINLANRTIPIEPQVVSRGFIYMKDSEELTKHFIQSAKEHLITLLNQYKTINLENIKYQLQEYVSKLIYDETDRKPMVMAIFMPIK